MDFKDLPRRADSDKEFCDRAFNITKNPKDNGYQCRLVTMVYNFLDNKKPTATCGNKFAGASTLSRAGINF